MASVIAEYQRFLGALALRPVDDDVCRMANLVYTNLSQLAQVGTARRGRSLRLAPLAINQFSETSSELPAFNNVEEGELNTGRLHELRVGPFRGFTNQEIFDLSNSITLIYGANGTGKSSFCEALETAFLGSISEAQVKRINHNTYCDNARLRRHVAPVITTIDGGNPPVNLIPNEEEYRFCFIEKNRLDDFARIASKTPSDQRQIIATLFGIDQFSDFVRGFNPSLDENLNLIGQRSLELTVKRTALSSAEKTIQEYPQKLTQLGIDETTLAAIIQQGSDYEAIKLWLLGNHEQQGRLYYVQGLLDSPSPEVYDLTPLKLTESFTEVFSINNALQEMTAELTRRSGEVSYKQLYEAVLELASLNPDECPACGTNLLTTTKNPYESAALGLEQLGELAELQRQSKEKSEELQESMRNLHLIMGNVIRAASVVCPDKFQMEALPDMPPTSTGQWLQVWVNDNNKAWNYLLSMSADIEASDINARQNIAQRQQLAVERSKLDGYRLEIERAKLVRQTAEEQLLEARNTVASFDEANRELIELVAAEGAVVEFNSRVKRAYDGFLREIKSYLSNLPAQLLQGLGDRARDLYNSFNRDDLPVDLLHGLWLPIAENGKIELEFQEQVGIRFDALTLLSEGHIKCLGLAILLAKNIEEGCPIVVFDDVVNAIDDEHRNGIWRTFFEDGLLDEKQVILTSHAEEFLHRIQQELGAARANNIKMYKFLPHQGEHHLRVDSNPPTKNYVIRAQQSFDNDDKRDALMYSRAGIESLTDRLWTWMGRRGDGRIELKLSGPRSPWELNNKCNKIRSLLRRGPNQSEGILASVGALDSLLGVANGSIEWGYLNSGTHDSQRDGEFDRAAVNTIVQAINSLDQALIELQNGG
ncbi:AAA family ATPase [Marinomonas primoryensis]|jgi:recombinational DNA repair ATPase RecF|uniref:AAA family ATPase n=1 Tax=Marinomonas primoryensis TaxID=178399 RepID=A0ABV0L1Y1_9GAMM|tara:strand:+ start:721 stop:3354 length:2634 start_codon:yes stop_codon:yes gene_type:complete